ncbi:MAG TPA: hypothetical protein VEL76_29330 [Gemmataceae bacterium]|nr:hypothetical protein [Gemmataceae bacterium]
MRDFFDRSRVPLSVVRSTRERRLGVVQESRRLLDQARGLISQTVITRPQRMN